MAEVSADDMVLSQIAHDVGVSAILAPAGCRIETGVPVLPSCRVINHGINAESNVPVYFEVDSCGVGVYLQAELVSLAVGDTVDVSFAGWTPGAERWNGYTLRSFTVLAGDGRRENDSTDCYVMVVSDTLYSWHRSGSTAPVIDGYVATGEWDAAYRFDASNLLGAGDECRPPGSAVGYLLHDDDYLYLAVELPSASTRDIGDHIALYCDENDDGAWATDLSEGNHFIKVDAENLDQVSYRFWTSSGPGSEQATPGSASGSSVFGGHLVFESRLPLGTMPYELNLDPEGDVCGAALVGSDDEGRFGWWLPEIPADSIGVPGIYGALVLLPPEVTGDVGVVRVDAPAGNVRTGSTVQPRATWRNYGSTTMEFDAFFLVANPTGGRVYADSQTVTLNAGQSQTLSFTGFGVGTDTGSWSVRCSTVARGDIEPDNDVLDAGFRVVDRPDWPAGWVEVLSMPSTPSGQPVKRGGWLAYDEGSGLIYATKGNKTGDFYCYDPNNDAWTELATIPPGASGKPPDKGARGISDGSGVLYATKGKNTAEFWQFDAGTGAWTALPDVPLGVSGKKVKGGTDMLYIEREGRRFIYLLKGYRTEFWRYDIEARTWQSLPDAPVGVRAKWDKGSWLARQGNGNRVFAHKAKYNELWEFDLEAGGWASTMLQGMPFVGRSGRSKKSKDGGSAVWSQGLVWALKGGNTGEFWTYDPGANSWTEQDLLPELGSTGKRKRVKHGGDLATVGGGAFFALKGNKTREFWRYVVATAGAPPGRAGVAAEPVEGPVRVGIEILQNPVTDRVLRLRYALPEAGPGRVLVVDAGGRTVGEQGLAAGRTGLVRIELGAVSAGVYLVRLEAGARRFVGKLVVR